MTTSNETTIAINITATGADSRVPNDPTAVDADVTRNGEYVCSVTLIRDHDGDLVVWGDPDMWCSHIEALEALIGEDETLEDVADLVIDLVREAA